MSASELEIFLLMGQANMLGLGRVQDVAPIEHPDIMVFRYGAWHTAREPLFDSTPRAGIGLGMSFALRLIEEQPGRRVGLVPCAVGGSGMWRWAQGGDLFIRTLTTAASAMQGGLLRGVLWHHGEGDAAVASNAAVYEERVRSMINGLRTALGGDALPVVMGELGTYLDPKCYPHRGDVNDAMAAMARECPHCALVSSEGLADDGGRMYFSARSLRELGVRYAEGHLMLAREHLTPAHAATPAPAYPQEPVLRTPCCLTARRESAILSLSSTPRH
ncbi:sialate O-acetylesterase [bacterium]|nr:sialate O-acetylesterase [bacterium]